MRCGLIGRKLGHSYSKIIHEMIAPYSYDLIELDPSELEHFIKEKNFKGINVTIPYKTDIIPYLDYIDPVAEKIGAVNTVVNKNGSLFGYNTDIIGLTELITSIIPTLNGKKVLIAGSGGTSKTAAATVEGLGCDEFYIVGRSKRDGIIDYSEAYSIHSDADVIINTTPLGMYPDFESTPFDLSKFNGLSGVVDVVYNPLRTSLVLQAQSLGIPAVSGLQMLISQAFAASELFTDSRIKASKKQVFDALSIEKLNIVLTGMPGSGKTTLGKLLSEHLGRNLVDVDEEIVKQEGRPICEIFEKNGEEYFRRLESDIIKKISRELTGVIISTGGGAVLRGENIMNLKHNGRIVFINRPVEEILPTSDRPLSSDKAMLQKRYDDRIDIYRSTADVIISNSNKSPNEALNLIIQELQIK